MNIALLDDKQYGLTQIQNALPVNSSAQVQWFSTVSEFMSCREDFDIVFLDYYLDKDGITGDTIIDAVRKKAKEIVAFSSISRGNEKLKAAGADFAIIKTNTVKNEDIENLLLQFHGEC